MFKYLYKIKDGQRVPCLPSAAPLLPSPDAATTPEERCLTAAVNKHINKQLSAAVQGNSRKYNKLDDETRTKIAKKCIEIGASKTARHFKERGLDLNESTVRSIKKSFCSAKAQQKTDNPVFKKNKRGAKLLLGDIDQQVLSYVKQLRIAGGVVNRTLLVAIARGFVLSSTNCQIKPESINNPWAQSFLKRHCYVKRKGTKAARKLPDDFPAVKEAFLQQVREQITQHNIPDDLVINFDQTGRHQIGHWRSKAQHKLHSQA